MKVTFIGHGTVLIELDEQYFLTDPNFSNKILHFKRSVPPGLKPADLPPLSAILISHSHYDHLDLFSFKYFKSTIPVIVPKGLGKLVRKFLPHPVVEIPPWSYHLHHGVEIHAVPVKHHGSRWFPLRHGAATAFVLKSKEGTVYFAGDTGSGEHFVETASLFDIDIALLPIAGYKPKWLQRNFKMNPEQALSAFEQLRAKHMMPINWGTFRFYQEKPEEGRKQLEELTKRKNFSSRIHILEPGKSFEYSFCAGPIPSLTK